MPPDPHTEEELRRPSPDPTPVGAPALRAYRASRLPRFVRGLRNPEILDPPPIHPLKILATFMRTNNLP